jgi:hypothetical protein
VVAPLLHR